MHDLLQAIFTVMTPLPFLFMAVGALLGIVVGAIPGLTGSTLIALTLPLTFSMSALHAIILLVSMYVGSITGGLISAILLRMPGTPASVMTTFDGHPLAKSGKAGRALGLAITASFVGGMASWVVLVLLAEPLSVIATRLSPFDYFSLTMMALVLIASVSQGSLIKGLLSGFLGMLVSFPGVDPSAGMPRLTWGVTELNGGLGILPVLIGLFAVGQVISDSITIEERGDQVAVSRRGIWLSFADWRRFAGNMLRSSAIGTWIGILPGVGAAIGSIIAYTAEKGLSKHPERFGRGAEEGIVASEAANNATVGGALVPLIAMGIPGSVIDVFLISGLMIHSIQPGPLLFVNHPDLVWGIIAANLVSTVFVFIVMMLAVGWIAKFMLLPKAFILPAVLVFCVVGAFASNNIMFDVWLMLGFGLLGFALERAGVPLGPFVIGFILAPLAEQKLRTGLMISGGSYWPLVTDWFSVICLSVSAVLLVWPMVNHWRRLRRAAAV